MNRKRMSVIVTLSIALATTLSIVSAPLTSAATKPKAAGRTSTTIPNTILNGKGAPLSKIGIDGDFYIDTRSLLIYGPKKVESGRYRRICKAQLGQMVLTEKMEVKERQLQPRPMLQAQQVRKVYKERKVKRETRVKWAHQVQVVLQDLLVRQVQQDRQGPTGGGGGGSP
jgi:hypothetical protein